MTELLGQETSLNSLEESGPEGEDYNEDGDGEDDGDDDDKDEDDEDEDGDDVKEDDSKVDDIDEGKDSNGFLNHGGEILTEKVPVPRKMSPNVLADDDTVVVDTGNENKRTLASSDASTSCTSDKLETEKRVREN